MRVGVVACSSVVPLIELGRGVDRLRAAGLDVIVHPQIGAEHFTLAGDDATRLAAFADFAYRDDIDILWLARGGYGSTRLLPDLERMTFDRGTPPRKLLAGYSDVTALHEFVHSRWGWPTLHAAMPAGLASPEMSQADFDATLAYALRQTAHPAWQSSKLQWMTHQPDSPITGTLFGGNLTVLNCLCGTPFAPGQAGGRILFLEDVSEAPYRLDRMLTQFVQAGGLKGVRAIILGDFTDCNDSVTSVLADGQGNTRPLRRTYETWEALGIIIRQTIAPEGIPTCRGLPVGHGLQHAPLPLNATYTLTPQGTLTLKHWSWTQQT